MFIMNTSCDSFHPFREKIMRNRQSVVIKSNKRQRGDNFSFQGRSCSRFFKDKYMHAFFTFHQDTGYNGLSWIMCTRVLLSPMRSKLSSDNAEHRQVVFNRAPCKKHGRVLVRLQYICSVDNIGLQIATKRLWIARSIAFYLSHISTIFNLLYCSFSIQKLKKQKSSAKNQIF